jgi:hypothetical protein
MDKLYEKIVYENDINKDFNNKALTLVKKYIIENKLILTGGMAIDLALRTKQKKLYDDDALPDYDFYSTNHVKTAYEIGIMLFNNGLKNVEVINAAHVTTMRVRVNFFTVADVTYIPERLYKKILTLSYSGFIFEHPHYKMINMHRSLSYPYENTPQEVIKHRWVKDVERFNLLFENFPIIDQKVQCDTIDLKILEKLGVECILTDINYEPFVIISDKPIELTKSFMKYFDSEIKYFNKTLDNINSYIEIRIKSKDQKEEIKTYHIWNNYGQKVAIDESKTKNNIKICNAQPVLSYFLYMYLTTDEKKYIDYYTFILYNLENPISADVYGEYNIPLPKVVRYSMKAKYNKLNTSIDKPPKISIDESTVIPKFKYDNPLYYIDGDETDGLYIINELQNDIVLNCVKSTK